VISTFAEAAQSPTLESFFVDRCGLKVVADDRDPNVGWVEAA